MVEKEIGVFVPKGYTVSDWEARPFTKKQISYALNDVIYLYDLWKAITEKLQSMDRESWSEEECEKMCHPEFYFVHPHKEAFRNNAIPNLNSQEQIFMVRLFNWRKEEARKKNYSKEMILPKKLITPIVKNMNSGKNALLKDRRLPTNTISKHWDTFNELFNRKISPEDRETLKEIPERQESPDPKQNTMLEMLYSIVEYMCQRQLIAPSLVLNRTSFKLMKSDPAYFDESLSLIHI